MHRERPFTFTTEDENKKNPRIQFMTQQKLDDFNKIKTDITKNDILNACVKLVTVNDRPFSFINNSGFKNILNPLFKGMKQKRITVTPSIVRNLVEQNTLEIRLGKIYLVT